MVHARASIGPAVKKVWYCSIEYASADSFATPSVTPSAPKSFRIYNDGLG